MSDPFIVLDVELESADLPEAVDEVEGTRAAAV